jgi:hypothetical protein
MVGVQPVVAPVFVTDEPIMTWLDEAFLTYAHRVPLAAGELTGNWPPVAATAFLLRAELEQRSEDGEPPDELWAAVARLARAGGEPGRQWQLIACGLALAPLREAARSLRAGSFAERCDIHADLIEAFLTGLCKIEPGTPGVARILTVSARKHAQRHHDARLKRVPKPAKPGRPPYQPPLRLSGPRDAAEALAALAARFAAAGRSLEPDGVELIARTVLDGEDITIVAAALGISLAAAYKRRQRTEHRIALALHISARRRASGRSMSVSRARDRGRNATAYEA